VIPGRISFFDSAMVKILFKYSLKNFLLMKKNTLLIALILLTVIGFTQVPDAFNYQAVVRNLSGEIVANQSVSFRISILQNSETGAIAYQEKHNVSTNNFGLANLKIGRGTSLSGVFMPGGWGVAPHFIKIEFDENGGNNFIHLGTSQLLAVPYAFHAQTVENVPDDDPTNELQQINLSGTQLSLSNGGGTVTLPATGGGDNWGSQVIESDATLNGEGTTANPLSVNGVLTDDQTLSISGTNLTIEGGNTVALPTAGGGDNWGTQTVESDATLNGEGTTANPLSVIGDLTDDQTLSIAGNDLSIEGGNTITLPEASTPWEVDDDNVFRINGKVAVGKNPGADLRKFQSLAGNMQAIAAINNGSYASIFAQNQGAGPAAEFRNPLRIKDGTEGTGKVLTSDANGLTSWQTPASGSLWLKNGNEIYYNYNVGIKTDNPENDLHILDVNAGITVKGKYAAFTKSGNAEVEIDKYAKGNFGQISYKTNGADRFFAGLLGDDNFQISTSTSTLNGIEIESDGDLEISDELHRSSTGAANLIPIAYGTVKDDGTLYANSNNVSVERDLEGRYHITIANEDYYYQNYIVSATIVGSGGIISASSGSDKLYIFTRDYEGTYKDQYFSFVVYKP
jgi:hypothetical protein